MIQSTIYLQSTIALVFGRKAPRVVVPVGLGLFLVSVLASVLYLTLDWIQKSDRQTKVQAEMNKLPRGIADYDRKLIEDYLRTATGEPDQTVKVIENYVMTHLEPKDSK